MGLSDDRPNDDLRSSEDQHRSGLSGAAARAAFFPARAAAKAWRDELETAVDEVLSAPEIGRVIDRALAGPLPEEIARSIVRHRVLERIVAELASSGELERLLTAALASPETLALTDRVLASDETQHALRHVTLSPEIRDAAAELTTGFVEEIVVEIRKVAAGLDDRIEHAVSRRVRAEHPRSAGVATRALALATDALLVTGLYMGVVGVVAVVASLVGGLHPEWLVGTLLSVGWVLLAGGYFVLFWSTTGHTPGMRLLHLRLLVGSERRLSIGRAVVRVVGLALSIALAFLGFVPVLFDERRRGLADFMAGTVVVYG